MYVYANDRFKMFYVVTFPMTTARSCLCPGNPADPNVDQLKDSESSPPPPNLKPERPRKRCCPYDFDGKMCRTVGDRVLCGFDKNVGKPIAEGGVMLGNGCRLTGNRLECGYFEGPFTNSRRPPDWNYLPDSSKDTEIIELSTHGQDKLVAFTPKSETNNPPKQQICRKTFT